jgi:flagellar hook-basal body complex protein FliE
MNPLSALRTLATPVLRPEPMAAVPGEVASPKSIPFSELEKLSPGILPLPVEPAKAAPVGFDKLVTDFVGEVSAKQAAASDAVNGLVSGKNVSHQTMIAMEEASISFQLMVEVRNKLLESYQELMRMQV